MQMLMRAGRYQYSFQNSEEPDYNSFEDSKKILAVLRKLHKADITADYGMKPWEDALDMEKLLEKKDPVCFVQYEGLKNNIGQLYKMTLADGVEKMFLSW